MDYEKAYKKALEIAKNIYGASEDKDILCTLETIFPELKESEDDRIIKTTISFLKEFADKGYENAFECIDWIEKQGEHANFRNKIQIGDKVTRNEDGVLVNISQLNRVAKKRQVQREQKPADNIEPKFKVGDLVVLSTSDGEKVVHIDSVEYFKSGEPMYITSEGRWFGNGTKAHLWTIKDTKDGDVLVWSEEDENGLGDALWAIQQAMTIAKDENDMGNLWYAENWLKSLKPQNRWKPSKKQMNALDSTLQYSKVSHNSFEHLNSLYNDLKKLKGE